MYQQAKRRRVVSEPNHEKFWVCEHHVTQFLQWQQWM